MGVFTKGTPKPANSGRKKGVRNKATADIKELAQQHGPAAIATLVELMMEADFEPTRVAAAKELLDRGYGKAAQVVDATITQRIQYEIELAFGQTAHKPTLAGEDDLPRLPNGRDIN